MRALLVGAAAAGLLCWLLASCGYSSSSSIAALGTMFCAFSLYPAIRVPIASVMGPAAMFIIGVSYLVGCAVLLFVILFSGPAVVESLSKSVRIIAGFLTVALVVQLTLHYGFGTGLNASPDLFRDDFAASRVEPSRSSPDVYHIILDGFGRPDVLNDMYDLDLSPVLNELKVRGFEVEADRGVANYTQTYLSLASMLNGIYLDSLGKSSTDAHSRAPLHALIRRSAVLKAFKRLGYDVLFLGSIYSATQRHELADECECDFPLIGEFESLVIRNTPIIDSGLGGLDHRPHRNKIERTFSSLESLEPASRPRLTLAHIMAPHPPFVFDARGRDVVPSRAFSFLDGNMFPGSRAEYEQGYRDQAQYVAARLLRMVDRFEHISRQHGRGAVIIVHGDHGPRLHFHASDAKRTDPSESIPILLAIKWAGRSSEDRGRPVESLVNVYRELFRRYFDADLKLLPDRAFVSSFLEPYRFLEIGPNELQPGAGASGDAK